jgi:hypothetical protein
MQHGSSALWQGDWSKEDCPVRAVRPGVSVDQRHEFLDPTCMLFERMCGFNFRAADRLDWDLAKSVGAGRLRDLLRIRRSLREICSFRYRRDSSPMM